jgi:protein-S-isoprenylcysteine O-methyltransferase Ste14
LKQKLLNATPDITLFGAIVGAYFLDRFIPVVELIGPPFSYIGWLVALAGVVLVGQSLSLLRERASSDVVRTSQVLITDNLFAFSRNPLYASELLVVIGVVVVLGSLTAIAAPVIYIVVVRQAAISYEENQLKKKFGAKYEAYARSVRRWM